MSAVLPPASPSCRASVYFNPWDEDFRANPYPFYAPLLAGPPLVIERFFPMVVAARYADAAAILADHRRYSSVAPKGPLLKERFALFGEAARVLFSDPPVHTRLRRLVSRAFTPRRVAALELRVRQITRELLDRAAADGRFDAVAALANPLPIMIIAEMLGVPPQEYPVFKKWSDAVVQVDTVVPGNPIPQTVYEAVEALRAYFAAEIARRRQTGADDLVSVLVSASEQGEEVLSAEELIAFVILLLLAGNETTTNLIGNGMLALARHPESYARLRQHPELIASAVEEMLRFDGPVQATVRYLGEETEFGGRLMPRETPVFVVLAAANRDPARFARPEMFDIARKPNDHLAFGDGIHYCLGAALARLEATAAFSGVVRRFARIELIEPASPLRYRGSYFVRGLSSLALAAQG